MSEKTIRFINIPDNLKINANTHSFNTSLAEAVGLVEAILLQNFFYWHNCNEGNKDMTKEGRVWFFRSVKQISEEYKYLSVGKVRDAIERLVYSGLVIKGDFNEDKVQRTSWYSLSDKVLEIFGKSQAICDFNKPFAKITNINYNKETIIRNKEKEEYNSSKKKNANNGSEEQKTWRNDFDTYRQLVEQAKEKLKADVDFRAKMEEIHIDIDYDRTLENSVVVFWGTEEGWKKKCSARGKNIDIVATLKKCFDKNKVYKKRTYNTTGTQYMASESHLNLMGEKQEKQNLRPDGTWVLGRYLYYKRTNGETERIDDIDAKDVPLRPDERHNWSSVCRKWAILKNDDTVIIDGKRWYRLNDKWFNIPMDAPERTSWDAYYDKETKSWKL